MFLLNLAAELTCLFYSWWIGFIIKFLLDENATTKEGLTVIGVFVVAIVTGFFSVLGMAIERFHMFAVVRDYSAIKRKFSIIWFLSSWTLSIVFVIILLPQIRDQVTCDWST